MKTYVLGKGGDPIREEDMGKWGLWFETADRQVANDHVGDANISTIFLGMDHSWSATGPPVLWETMVFGGEHNDYQERCSGTAFNAINMHAKVVAMVRGNKI